jgi:hypothetical protein
MHDYNFVITKTRTAVDTGTDGKKAVIFNIQYRDGSTNVLDTCANLINFLGQITEVQLISKGTSIDKRDYDNSFNFLIESTLNSTTNTAVDKAITKFTTPIQYIVNGAYDFTFNIGATMRDSSIGQTIITDSPTLGTKTQFAFNEAVLMSNDVKKNGRNITKATYTITGDFINITSNSEQTTTRIVVRDVSSSAPVNATTTDARFLKDEFTLNNDSLQGLTDSNGNTLPNMKFINGKEYHVWVSYSNQAQDPDGTYEGGSSKYDFKFTPTNIPAATTMKFMSNLELADSTTVVEKGATLFWTWPANKVALETANTPIRSVTVSYKVLLQKDGVWTAQNFQAGTPTTEYSTTYDISSIKVDATTWKYTSPALRSLPLLNGPSDISYAFSHAWNDIPAGTAVQAQVYFSNIYSVVGATPNAASSNNVMVMKLPDPLDVKYVVDVSNTNPSVTFFYDISKGSPSLHGGVQQPLFKMTKDGTVTDMSFVRLPEKDITLGTFKVDLVKGTAHTFEFNTVTKSPFPEDNKSYVSRATDRTRHTIYGKGTVGQVTQIATYSLDSSNRPLTKNGLKAFSVNFIPPALTTALTGGIGGTPNRDIVKFFLYKNGVQVVDLNGNPDPINYPAVAGQEQSWTIVDNLIFGSNNYSVLVVVKDPQFTPPRSFGALPADLLSNYDVSGQLSASVAGTSLAYIPKVVDLTYDVSNQQITWKDQNVENSKADGAKVTNKFILTRDYDASVNSVLSKIWTRENSLNVVDLSNVTPSLISDQKYSVFVVPEYHYVAKDLSNTTVDRFNVKLRDHSPLFVSSLSFIAGKAPGPPRDLRVTSEDKGLGVMWTDSSLNGGEFSTYNIAAVKYDLAEVVAVDNPAFPTNQRSVLNSPFAASISVNHAFNSRSDGLDGKSIAFAPMNDDFAYSIAVRAETEFKTRPNTISAKYTVNDASSTTLLLESPSVDSKYSKVYGPWVVSQNSNQKPKNAVENAKFDIKSDLNNVVVEYTPPASNSTEAYIMYLDGRAQSANPTPYPALSTFYYDPNGVGKFLIDISASKVPAGKPVRIGFVNVRDNETSPLETSDISFALANAQLVVPGDVTAPGDPRNPLFKVDLSSIYVQCSPPTSKGAADQEIIREFLKYKASSISYDISYSVAGESTYGNVVAQEVEISGNWFKIPVKFPNNKTYNVDIRAKYTMFGYNFGFNASSAQATYNSAWVRVSTVPIRVGPEPLPGNFVINSLREDVSFNRISFQYKLPALVPNFPYSITTLQITDLSGDNAFSAASSGDISYNSVVTFDISNVLHGKEYNFQVAPVANYSFAQAPPATVVPKAVPFGKLNITSIQPSQGNPTTGYSEFKVTVDLNGDKLNDIILVSDPVGAGPLEVKVLVGTTGLLALPTMTLSGAAKTTAGTAASPLIAANQTATFTVSVQNPCVSLLLIANGKTSAIRNFPTNASLTF